VKTLWNVTLGLLALAAVPRPCAAQWGWPPPNYSTTGVNHCDGSHYRGLLAVWRDWRCRRRGEVPPGAVVSGAGEPHAVALPGAVPAPPQPALPPALPPAAAPR
jgi:hypothetical protein